MADMTRELLSLCERAAAGDRELLFTVKHIVTTLEEELAILDETRKDMILTSFLENIDLTEGARCLIGLFGPRLREAYARTQRLG
jgi:hypothetical protein